MGSYELEEQYKELHYTGCGWLTVKVTDEEIKKFKSNKVSGFDLFNDGREVY